jgi:hypothetical protein
MRGRERGGGARGGGRERGRMLLGGRGLGGLWFEGIGLLSFGYYWWLSMAFDFCGGEDEKVMDWVLVGVDVMEMMGAGVEAKCILTTV